VVHVSWNDVKSFIKRLNQGGAGFRLPTEAEWEYAARAETKTAFAFGNRLSSDQANFDGQRPYGGAPHGPIMSNITAVGRYQPNEWGVYDMHGNAEELVEDVYNGSYANLDETGSANEVGEYPGSPMRVVRGGSYELSGVQVRSGSRDREARFRSHMGLGFRLVLTLDR